MPEQVDLLVTEPERETLAVAMPLFMHLTASNSSTGNGL